MALLEPQVKNLNSTNWNSFLSFLVGIFPEAMKLQMNILIDAITISFSNTLM